MSDIAPYVDADAEVEWADLRPLAAWVREHRVLLGAVVLVVAQVAWKAQFLSHLYFRQDDFHDLDLAVDHHAFNWGYLTYIGSGHLIIGLRLIAWPLVRIFATPYNWPAASAVSLAFVAAAGLAAYRLLRDLFGDRPAILVLLAMYLLSPLTMPDLGIWSSAMESVPLQLAIFMAASAHLRYVRNGGALHLAAAVFWIAFGLAFFEKGLVLPVLLFALTAGYLTGRRHLLSGIVSALVRYWKAWVAYLVVVVAYMAILLQALRTSASQPRLPVSGSGVSTFTSELLRDTFLPGALGGPWKWFPVSGASYSFAAPPPTLVLVSVVVAVAVIVVSIVFRPQAWRAWVILAAWIALADMLPVVIGRLNGFDPAVLGLETRYVADATPVLVIAIGLAFLPLASSTSAAGARTPRASNHRPIMRPETTRSVVAVMLALFVFGSIWSVQAYENVTNGNEARTYIANAALALKQVPKGTTVVSRPLPQDILLTTFGPYAYSSKVLGAMETGKLAGKLRWITVPHGTVDNLWIFGTDGRLYQARVLGASARPVSGRRCFVRRAGSVRVKFPTAPPPFSAALRIGYFWYASQPASVSVKYKSKTLPLLLRPGLHSAFLPIDGSAPGLVIQGISSKKLCIGDVQAGNYGQAAFGRAIPPLPKG